MQDTPQPNLDERLNAIAMHLEVLSGMHQDLAVKVDTMAARVDTMAVTVDKMAVKVDKMADNIVKMADSITMLGRIAGLHEERLDEQDLSLDKIIERLQRIERKPR